MSILNITNLTDTPENDIRDKYLDAFEAYEKEMEKEISNEDKRNFIDTQIGYLEELMEDSKGSELLGIIDNYLVNEDYYANVKDWFENL